MKFYKQIFIFNRPLFVAAAIVCAICIVAWIFTDISCWLKALSILAFAGSFYFSACSLFFSYLIYDRSDLYIYKWLKPYFSNNDVCFNLFSGYSEGGFMLTQAFRQNEILQLDFFDTKTAVSSSIKKAKELSRDINSKTIAYDHWQIDEKAQLILFMQSLHELRRMDQKVACLREAASYLTSGGNIIIAEHLCDWKNFLIYGPGAFHFFGNRHWIKTICEANLSIAKTFYITPFIKVYIINN